MNIAAHPRLSHPTAPADGVTVLHGAAGMTALAQEWRALFKRAARPHQVFQSYAFLSLWAKHYCGDGCEPVVAVARAGGRAVAILPLVRQRLFGVPALRAMGLPVAQFSDMIAEPDASPALIAEMWKTIAGLGAHVLELRRVRADSDLARLAPPTPYVYERQQAPQARLERRVGPDGEPGEAYSAKYRSNYRRRLKRLGETGDVKMVGPILGREAQAAALLAVEMKRAWLSHHQLASPAVQDGRFAAFFAEAALDPDIALQACGIQLDGDYIAIDLSFPCKGACYGHVLAVDPAHEAGGLGPMTVHQSFAAARAGGAEMFDLLTPSSAYKMSHADAAIDVSSRLYAFTAFGRLFAAGLRHGLPAAKAAAVRMPRAAASWLGRKV